MNELDLQNVIGTAVLAQLLLIVILSVGSALTLRLGEWPQQLSVDSPPRLIGPTLFAGLFAFGSLFLSAPFVDLWDDMLGLELPGINGLISLALTFFVDSFLVYYLVLNTGGSRNSSFTPLFFLLPTLAILLRLPLWGIVFLTGIVSFQFSILSFSYMVPYSRSRRNTTNVTFVVISLSSFWLAVLIGYLTRPQ